MNRNAASIVGRIIIGLFGVGLLLLICKMEWSGESFHSLAAFGALIGLFLGYALGGDLWGARLFDLFAHTRSRKIAEEPLPPAMEKTAQILGVVFSGALILIAVFIAIIVMRHS